MKQFEIWWNYNKNSRINSPIYIPWWKIEYTLYIYIYTNICSLSFVFIKRLILLGNISNFVGGRKVMFCRIFLEYMEFMLLFCLNKIKE